MAATAGMTSSPVNAIFLAKLLWVKVPPSQQVPRPRSVANRMMRSSE